MKMMNEKQKVLCEKITTTTTQKLKSDFLELNKSLHKDIRVSWAECLRRGFYSLKAERERWDIAEIMEHSDIVPLQVRERIRILSERFTDTLEQLNLLRSQAGMLENPVKKEVLK